MITEAAYTFGIGIAAIYRWLSRPKLEATKVKSPRKKIRLKRIRKRCKINSRVDHWQTELKKIGVDPRAMFYALKRMKITRKKINSL